MWSKDKWLWKGTLGLPLFLSLPLSPSSPEGE